jgi:agmatinase
VAFDPNAAGLRNGQFGGLPTTPDEAEVVLVPVPWDVTVSSGDGTRNGPKAILDASPQLEFLNPVDGSVWTSVAMLPISAEVYEAGFLLRERARAFINWVEDGSAPARAVEMKAILDAVNAGCAEMNADVERWCEPWIAKGRVVGVVGGDHSTPLGFYRALARAHGPFGVLHIDAHCDLRAAYEGLCFSHASILRNACDEGHVSHLVQVGVRDYCAEERAYIDASPDRIRSFNARMLARRAAAGETWTETVRAMVKTLPRDVLVTFDIDGLEPWQCPHTGTPVPGGLGYEESFHLLEELVATGRRIVGFDVTEVAPDAEGGGIDAIVGARVVYRLACLAAMSQRPCSS